MIGMDKYGLMVNTPGLREWISANFSPFKNSTTREIQRR
jgi:hypothetical protein